MPPPLFLYVILGAIFDDAEQENQGTNDPKSPSHVSAINYQCEVTNTPFNCQENSDKKAPSQLSTFNHQFGVLNTPFYNQVRD